MDMEDLQAKFHALNGTNLPEHYRNFNSFVRRLDAAGENAHASISSLEARNLQEKIFKAKLLLKYGRTDELLAVLLEADKYLNRILSRNVDFLRSLVRTVRGDEFVDRICPRISYVTRTRLANRLPYFIEDVDVARLYYEGLLKRYGFKTAMPFLVSCSVEFILAAIAEYRPTFTDRQLVYLHRKRRAVVPAYFETKRNFGGYTRFARYLCSEDVEMFGGLLEYGTPKIGKRAFSRFYARFGGDVVCNPGKYPLPLRHRIVRSSSSAEQYEEYFANLPKSDVTDDIVKAFSLLSKDTRGAVLERKYGPAIFSNRTCPQLFDLLTPEDRLKYNLGDESIPKLLGRIALTRRVPDRCKLVEKVIETCRINGDADALLEVLEYFWERHRSDIVTVRRRIFKYLHDRYDLARLSGEHWRYIGDLLRVFQMNDEYCEVEIDVWRKYLVHRVVNGLDYVHQFKCLLKVSNFTTTKILNEFPDHERACILMYPGLISDVHKTEESRRFAQPFILDWIADFNSRNPTMALSYYEHVDAIEYMLKEQREVLCYYTDAFRQIFKHGPVGDAEEKSYGDIVRCFLASYYPDENHRIVTLWLVRHKPSAVCEHRHLLFKKWTDKVKRSIFREISRSHYTELCISMKADAFKILNDPKSPPEELGNALNFLAFFDDFNLADYTEKLRSDRYVAALDAKEHVMLLQAQLCAFQNTAKPAKQFAALVELYKQKHVRYAASLHNVVLNMPESNVTAELPRLMSQCSALRCHGIYFACIVGHPNIESLILGDEDDELVRKIITNNVFRCFVETQSATWWRLLVKCIDNVHDQDRESFEMLVRFERIPEKYLDRYVRLVWSRYKSETAKYLTLETFAKLSTSLQDDLFDAQNRVIVEYFLEPSNTHRLVKVKSYNLLESICTSFCRDKGEDVDRKLRALSELDFDGVEFELLRRITKAYLGTAATGFAEFTLQNVRSLGEVEFLRKFLSRVAVEEEFLLDVIGAMLKLDTSVWSKIVGVLLLPRRLDEDSGLKMRYEAAICDIRDGCRDDIVNVYLMGHLLE